MATWKKSYYWLIGILLALVVLAAGLGYHWGWFRLPMSKVSAFEAVPHNTAFLLTFKGVGGVYEKLDTAIYRVDLKEVIFTQRLRKDIDLMQQLLGQQEALAEVLQEGRMIAAAAISKAKIIDFIYVFDEFESVIELETCLNNLEAVTIERSVFSQRTIYDLTLASGETFSLCHTNNLLIGAESSFLIEFAIDQLEDYAQNITRQRVFEQMTGLVGRNSDMTLYLNFEHFPTLASHFVKAERLKELNALRSWGNWLGLDILFQETDFVINGYFHPSEKNAFLSALRKQPLPPSISIAEVLPDHTAFVLNIGVESFKTFVRDLNPQQGKYFKNYLLPCLEHEWAYVITEPINEAFAADQFVVATIREGAKIEEQLEFFAQSVGALTTIPYNNYTIKRILLGNFASPIFGETFNPIHHPYYVILDGRFVVFANDVEGLKTWIDKFMFNQTLGQDINYHAFIENLAQTSNLSFYINTANVAQLLKAYLKPDFEMALQKEFQAYQKIKPIGIQLTPYDRLFFTNGYAKFDEKGKQPASVVWRAELLVDAAIPPKIVKNHDTKALEIIIQDEADQLYLLNRNGEHLWNEPVILGGKIISTIYQIDYYKNNKLQYLFNTRDTIYLIDRKGKMVKGYPRGLSSPATNGVFVIDYDTDKDYYMFVACENGHIYGFEKNGQPLGGWTPREGIGHISLPMQHFKVEEEDYLVALNDTGQFLLFELNGNFKIPPIDLGLANRKLTSNFGFDMAHPAYRRVVTTDNRGRAYIANLDGETFQLSMNIGNNKAVKFAYEDVAGDARKDYILLSEQDLAVNYYTMSNEFKTRYIRQFPEPQDDIFTIQLPHTPKTSKKHIATVAQQARHIYLLNKWGKPYDDFPLGGSTRFEIVDFFEDGKNILVVANGNLVYAYKLTL